MGHLERYQRGFGIGLIALGIVLLGLTAWGVGASALAKHRKAEVLVLEAKLEKLESEYETYKADVKRAGDEAKKKKEAEERAQAEVNNALVKKLKAMGNVNAELRADNLRLRSRPPTAPDGSEVSVSSASCPAAGTSGPPAVEQSFVKLDDYRELEGRCAYDARTVTLWRGWAKAQGLAGPEARPE